MTITKKLFSTKSVVEKTFIVQNPIKPPELNANVKMEVGMSNLVHLEYEIFKNKFFLDECIVGKIYFINVQMKIKVVEVHLIRKEMIGVGINSHSDSTLITKFEIVDGNPANDEIVPLRMFINSYELSPTYKDINNTISVRYYLKFVVIDNEDKSLFKLQEIILWRKYIN